jgi:hypothetical protein
MWRTLLTAGLAVCLGGCANGPLLDNPFVFRTDKVVPTENPVYLPQGPMAYARVFEKVLDVVDDYFDIAYANRYDGRIETYPRIAPGLEQPWKPGSPDCSQRLLAFLQTIRHRAIVVISTANDGGYFIDVKVLKELEDVPAPMRSTAGEATFRLDPQLDRQFEVIDPFVFEASWIPIGRDCKLEQCILQRIAAFDISGLPKGAVAPCP